jgi:RNase adapter protein RapZ
MRSEVVKGRKARKKAPKARKKAPKTRQVRRKARSAPKAGKAPGARSVRMVRAPRPTRTVRTARPRGGKRASSFFVITGMSGAGKSHAIRALEDLGYYCVDNLPTSLIPVLADLSLHEDADNQKIGVVVDVREKGFIRDFPRIWRELGASADLRPMLVFLEASDAALLRRFSETRRPHPLAPNATVAEALKQEREMLAKIRSLADEIIDTSDLTVHELRQIFHAIARGTGDRTRLIMTFESFGFKHGVPLDADLVFDCRFLPNPHFVAGLRSKTGKDAAVINYMLKHPATHDFRQRLEGFLRYLVPHYVTEGKAYLTVAIGCTGGRHRSVYLAELLKKELSGLKNVSTRVRHRDLARDAS